MIFLKVIFSRLFRKAVALSSQSRSLEIKSEDKILIVAPHPDDETFGCGGLLALFPNQCEVLLLTLGESGIPNLNKKETTNTRYQEFSAAMAMAGVSKVHVQNIPDLDVVAHCSALNQFDFSSYSKIFIPNINDTHPDHVAANAQIQSLTRTVQATLLQYEIWSALPFPTHFLEIDEVIDTKKKMIECYASQNAEVNYLNGIIGLNQYRSLNGQGNFCEAYSVIRN